MQLGSSRALSPTGALHPQAFQPPGVLLLLTVCCASRFTCALRRHSEDVRTAEGLSPAAAKKLFTNLASAAESGVRLCKVGELVE